MDAGAIGLSGIRTAALGVAVAANNVANAQTDGFRALRMDQEDMAGGGVRPATLRASEEAREPGGSNVDLATEMTGLTMQSGAYAANLKVLEAQEQMLGQALDLRA